ncbi:MAG: hypothetical protein AB1568_16320 [Thermodesulfobacteriota bacterium]
MQLADPNLHQRLLEMCDCYLETDFAKQLNVISHGHSKDLDEDAIKYLALAIMYGVSEQADELKMKKKKDGKIKVLLQIDGEKKALPIPPVALFDRMLQMMEAILHLEKDGGELPLALGLRTSQLELQVKVKEKEDETSMKITYPA